MKILSRSLAAVLLVGVTVSAAPVMAQKKAEAPKPPKLSKPVAAALSEAQKLQTAGDHVGALAKVAEAEVVPGLTADDTYFIAAIKLNSAVTTKNNPLIEEAITKMLATGKVAPADEPKFVKTLGALAMERKDYNTATKAFERLTAMNPNDADNQIALAEL